MYTLYKFHILNGISEINQLFDDILIIWPAPVYDDQSLLISFSSLIFWVWLFVIYGIDLVSIPRYYILVSYQSQNYGIEPSLIQTQLTDLTLACSIQIYLHYYSE